MIPDRRVRVTVLSVILVVLTIVLAFQAATADPGGGTVVTNERDDARNGTLIAVQSFGGFGQNNGKALIVENGDVVWEYDPPNSRVFDVEVVDEGRIMASVATDLDGEDCPEAVAGRDACVKNRIVEIDVETKEVVWNYTWYDAFIHYHEVHDADRLENGNTAIIDRGNDRAFTVDRSGEIVWEWQAEEHITPGTDFYEEYGGPEKEGPETDWTHMNDIDRLENGNFQLSIRNFDVLLEVDPETNDIVDVVGEPRGVEGNDPVLHEQHNPHRLEEWGTVLVADSEANRVVELDVENETTVWVYGGEGTLNWPRDADRLPNGHTLITDSLGFRVIQVNETGDVVWEFHPKQGDKRGIPYEADHIDLPEEPGGPPGWDLNMTDRSNGSAGGTSNVGPVEKVRAYALLYLPQWVETPELVTLLLGVLLALGIVIDFAVLGVRRAVW
jgi:hypothetical protein